MVRKREKGRRFDSRTRMVVDPSLAQKYLVIRLLSLSQFRRLIRLSAGTSTLSNEIGGRAC